jgi:CheY-like chemotaxis protein
MRKLLIVEDEPIVALDLHQEIEHFGFEVVGIAESAEEAMAIAEMYHPDLALMDINIAGSMDGIQTARLLRSAYQIRSLFLTSYHDDTTMKRAMQDMPYGYLTKPYQSHELKAAIMVALRLVEADEVAKNEEHAMLAAVSAMRDGLVTVSIKGSIQFMNAAAGSLAGVPPIHARGRQFAEVMAMKDANLRFVDSKILPVDGSDLEGLGWTLCRPTGAELPVDVLFAAMKDKSGDVTGYTLTLRNCPLPVEQQQAVA